MPLGLKKYVNYFIFISANINDTIHTFLKQELNKIV